MTKVPLSQKPKIFYAAIKYFATSLSANKLLNLTKRGICLETGRQLVLAMFVVSVVFYDDVECMMYVAAKYRVVINRSGMWEVQLFLIQPTPK